MIKQLIVLLPFLLWYCHETQARDFVGTPTKPTTTHSGKSFRADCTESRSETEISINNVRARLRGGGDMWWDGNEAQYIIPNVDPASGEPEVSSLFAGAIWLGAYDDGGNLIVAAQTYRANGNDYWSGPLDPITGTVEKTDCERWDKHFVVYGKDIDALRTDYLDPANPGVQNTPSKGLLGWPARGNPHFITIHGFPIEEYDQDLAPFIDANGNGTYDPYDGDHPIIEVAKCAKNDYNNPVYADQMTWWVYNDNGNLHTQSNGIAMKMEVQALAFGYATTDAINDMTFYRYKLLNRNKLTLNNTYFSLWSDPDLGCSDDDYIGCDTVTGMGYVYNKDAFDDNPCGSGSNGYGAKIPALGVDYFRGPLDENGDEIGLSSFQYHLRGAGPMGDPQTALGFYRLMSGFWANDGTPVTVGGDGYNPNDANAIPTNYVFPSFPDDNSPDAWSMCSENLQGVDPRFLHTSGPFVLQPGRTNEMISGVVWVPEVPNHPCPSLRPLVAADVLAQNLFDNCFRITDGPDAPFIDVIEMDKELVLNLNYIVGQNNFNLGYSETPGELKGFSPLDTTYDFQGYLIYQVNDPNISVTELEDESKARLIYQTDVEDGISKIANWEKITDEDLGIDVNIPTIMVEGQDEGIKHTFRVLEDQFAPGQKALINHKPYYFCVVAYAHNEYEKFDPIANTGQARPYLQGRKNFNVYTGIPRINSPEYSGVSLNAEYGNRPTITRLDGQGVGSKQFLEISNLDEIKADILADNNVQKIEYLGGSAPVEVKVTDPLRVGAGTFNIHICDKNYTWQKDTVSGSIFYSPVFSAQNSLQDSLYWMLTDVNDPTQIWSSFQTMEMNYEQHIPDLGISITIKQPKKAGTENQSGAIGSRIVYDSQSTDTLKWYEGVKDGEGIFNMLKTGVGDDDEAFDPNQDYSEYEGGWYPFVLADAEKRASLYLTVGNVDSKGARFRNKTSSIIGKIRDTMLVNLNNVNIVFSTNPDEWSRCVVTESASFFHSNYGLGLSIPSKRYQMEWKGSYSPSNPSAPTYYSRNKDMSIDSSSVGMSWFPGYAYDVETGQRLNIFFGENSLYNGTLLPEQLNAGSNTGDDMIFNPTATKQAGPFSTDEKVQFLQSVMGGQHIIYVTNQAYDSCQSVISNFGTTLFTRPDNNFYKDMLITWASMATLADGTQMQGAFQQIPPSNATVKLRVNTQFKMEEGTNTNLAYPLYEFSLDGYQPIKEEKETALSALDLMRVVPNPYYAYSDYEITDADNVIKITNLPAQCMIRIYSLDGRFVKEYKVAQEYSDITRNGIARIGTSTNPLGEDQIMTSINWDIKNYAGVPVGSGVYLIHVVVPGVGEQVLKSFVINRAFDAQRL